MSALRLPMESTKNCPEKDDVLTVIVNLLGFCWLPKWTVAGMGVTTVGHKAVAWSDSRGALCSSGEELKYCRQDCIVTCREGLSETV